MPKGEYAVSSRSFLALSQMAHVIHMFKRYRQTHVTAFGVTVPQFNALVQLERYGELNPSQIADLLFSDRPTTTVIIKNLERRGWVKRERDRTNRKYVVIRITEAGNDKLRELREAEESQSGDFEPLACLTEEELSQLEAMLDKLILHFRNLPKITGPKGGT
jgi:DNA-binding MarR family transcriptional regulator